MGTEPPETPEPSPPAPGPPAASRERRIAARQWGWIVLAVLLIVVLVALIVANTESVRVDWVFGSDRQPLVGVLFVAALVGWVLGILTTYFVRRRTRQRTSRR
jgi:uncharacterized integral membrane protein